MIRTQIIGTDLTTVIATINQELDGNGHPQGILAGSDGGVVANEVGFGKVRLPADHPTLSSITEGRVIRTLVWAPTSLIWVPVSAFRALYRREVIIDTLEGAAKIVEWSGPGHGSICDEMPIQPRQAVPMAKVRQLGWATPELDVTAWTAPDVRSIIGDVAGPPDSLGSQPFEHPNPLCEFLWGTAPVLGVDADGICYFDAEFTLASPADLVVFPVGVSTFAIALDEAIVITQDSDPVTPGANPEHRVIKGVPTGTHTIRAAVRKVASASNPGNVGMFAIGIADMVEQTLLIVGDRVFYDWVMTSADDTAWSTLAYPANPPGFPAGWMVRHLGDGAQTAGHGTAVTFDFTDTTDTDAVAFDVGYGETVQVGSSLGSFMRSLAERAWWEWGELLDLPLSIGGWKDRGNITAVELEQAVDITQLIRELDGRTAFDALLVEWSGGYLTVGAGERCGFLQTSATTAAEAEDLGTNELARITATTETVTVRWDSAADETVMPHVAFDIGDTITSPVGDLRVAGIKWTLQNDRIDWEVTLGTMSREWGERVQRLARRVLPGALMGRSETAAPPTSFQPAAGRISTESWTVSGGGNLVPQVGDWSDPFALKAPGVICRATMKARSLAGATGTTTYILVIDGTDSLWEFDLAIGDTETLYPGLVIYGAPDVIYTMRCTDSGGHEGVSIDFTASHIP